ncbi:MAG: hypothetical protein AAFV53_12400 [Myxococcota bacterium]
MTHRILPPTGFLILLSGWGMYGCGSLGDLEIDFQSDDDRCQQAPGPDPDLTGGWQISGAGNREFCDDPILDTDRFTLNSRGALAVVQDESGDLSLAEPIDGFEFSGAIDGICVDFSTFETGEGIRYTWSGEIGETQRVDGSFDGAGPNTCLTSGTFTVIVE